MKVKQFDNPSTNCKQLSHFQIDFQASQKGKETVKSEETFKRSLQVLTLRQESGYYPLMVETIETERLDTEVLRLVGCYYC